MGFMPDGEFLMEESDLLNVLPALVPKGVPDLKAAHIRQLRFVFSRGRPVSVSGLSPVDLDLIAVGLLSCDTLAVPYGSAAMLSITSSGVKALKDALDKRRDVNDVHHSLGGRLARWLREERGCMTWENVAFLKADARLDVVSCARTPTARLADLAAYEVKVSVSDYRADLANPKKLQTSRDIAQAAWYCAPMGLIDVKSLPAGFGLICEVDPGQFEIVKRAVRKKGFIPCPDSLMTLVMRRATLPESERY